MSTPTRAPYRGAMALACAFSAVTAWLVFGDLPSPTAFTPGHAMSLLVVAGAVYFGHAAFPAIKSGRLILGASMGALAIGCTAYVGLAAGIRYSATATTRAATIEDANRQRRQADTDAAAARTQHAEAQRDERAECGMVGPQCARKAQRTAAAFSHLLLADATRNRLGAIEEADAGIIAAARVLALLTGAPVERIAQALALGLPWLLVIVTEGAAIALWLAALPPARVPTAPALPAGTQVPATVPARLPAVPAQVHALPHPMTTGAAALIAVLRTKAQPMSVADAAAHMQVCRAEASKRYREAGAAIRAQRDGRRLLLSLA